MSSEQVGHEEQASSSGSTTSIDLRWAVAGLAFPALSYMVAYAIMVGEAGYFGVPSGLVSVSINDVLSIALTIGASGLTYALALRGLFTGGPLHPGFKEVAFPLSLIGGTTLLFWWSSGFGPTFWVWLGLMVLMTFLVVFSLVRQSRKLGGLRKALDAIANKEDAEPPIWSTRLWSTALDKALHLNPAAVVFLMFVVFYLAVLGSGIGRGLSLRQSDFLVAVSRPHQVVLLVNDGHAILGVLGSDGRTLTGEYEVVDITALGPVKKRTLGQLQAPPMVGQP